MTTYRVVWEIETEADTPLQAAMNLRDLREDHSHHPTLVVYSDDYRVTTVIDMSKPVADAIIATHGARKEPDW